MTVKEAEAVEDLVLLIDCIMCRIDIIESLQNTSTSGFASNMASIILYQIAFVSSV